MKKTLLTIATMVAGISSMNAQSCIISGGCTPGASGYCAVPSASTNLSPATVGTAYSSVIQFSLGTTAFGGAVTVNGATLTAVAGMPTGITNMNNPTSGAVAAGSGACIQLSGTSNATPGTYTITGTFQVSTSIGAQAVNADWYLVLNASGTGINDLTNSTNGVLVLAPNPAKNELTINSDLHLSKAIVIDALGKVVMTQELNYTNQAVINVANLERGVYFLQAFDGTKSMTKKFIKD